MPDSNNSVKNFVKKINGINPKASFETFSQQAAGNLPVRD